MPVPAAAAKAAQKTAERVLERSETIQRARQSRWHLVLLVAAGPPLALMTILVLLVAGISAPPKKDGSCPAGTAVPASVEIDGGTRDAINALKADYEAAAEAAGIPWTLLAAIDYRENGNDPGRSALSGEPIGSSNPDSGVVTSSKRDSLDRAAEHLKAMGSSVYGVALTPNSGGGDIKEAALAFNRGYIYQRAGASPDLSPYVLNQFDAAHNDMTWPDVPGEPLAGQVEYGRYGAYTLFVRLGGSTEGGCGGLSDDEIVRIAQGELGVTEDNPGSDCDCGAPLKYQGSTGPEDWCADFVSWVYNEAHRPFSGGLDGGWRIANVGALVQWLRDNGEWHVAGDGDQPRPGDVVSFRGGEHVGIVEGLEVVSGSRWTIHTIEGNSSDGVNRREYGPDEDGSVSWQVDGWGRQRRAA
jgi:hypothetical protein